MCQAYFYSSCSRFNLAQHPIKVLPTNSIQNQSESKHAAVTQTQKNNCKQENEAAFVFVQMSNLLDGQIMKTISCCLCVHVSSSSSFFDDPQY